MLKKFCSVNTNCWLCLEITCRNGHVTDSNTESNNNINEVVLVHENLKLFLVQQCSYTGPQHNSGIHFILDLLSVTFFLLSTLQGNCTHVDVLMRLSVQNVLCLVSRHWFCILLYKDAVQIGAVLFEKMGCCCQIDICHYSGISGMAMWLELKDIRMFPFYYKWHTSKWYMKPG